MTRFLVQARFAKEHVSVEILDDGVGLSATAKDHPERGLGAAKHLCPTSYVRKNEPTGIVGIIATSKEYAHE